MLKKVLLLCFVFTTQISVVCFSQSNILDKKISLNIQNKSLVSILETIQKKAGFTFSYNNSIIEGNKLTSITISNAKIRTILSKILGPKYQFSIYNTQILISLKPEQTSQKGRSLPIYKKSGNQHIIDTIHLTINDTIKKTILDTQIVKVTDTVTINDTIIVPQTKVEEIPKMSFYISALYSPTAGSVTFYDYRNKYSAIKGLIDNAESAYSGFDAGLQLDLSHKNLRYRTGIISTSLTKKISYSFDKEYVDDGSVSVDSMKLWQYHTILYYYKYKDGDTVKIPVIDSSQVYKTYKYTKKQVDHKTAFGTNTIKLIQIPVSVGYCFSLNARNTITPYLSARFYFVTIQNGYTYNSLTNNIDSLSKHNVSQFFVSTSLSFQYEFKINKASFIFIEPALNQFIIPIFNDKRNVNERLFQCNIAFGVRTLLCNTK